MKNTFSFVTVLAFVIGLGLAASMPSLALAADEKTVSACEKIEDAKKKAACMKKEAKMKAKKAAKEKK